MRRLLPPTMAAVALCACGLRPGFVHDALDNGRDPTPELTRRIGAPPGVVPQSMNDTTGLLLLERGTISLRQARFADASADLRTADLILDREDMRRIAKLKAMKSLGPFETCWQNGWAEASNIPYGPRVYEHLLLPSLSMVASLGQNDDAGAAVEARRLFVMSDFTQGYAPARARKARAFGEALGAIALSRASDAAAACRSADRSAFAPAHALCDPPEADRGWIAVVTGYGQVPHVVHANVNGPRTLEEPTHGFAGVRDLSIRVGEQRVDASSILTLDVAQEVRADFLEATTKPHVRVTLLGVTATVPCDGATTSWESLPGALHLALVNAPVGTHAVTVISNHTTQTHPARVEAGRVSVVTTFSD